MVTRVSPEPSLVLPCRRRSLSGARRSIVGLRKRGGALSYSVLTYAPRGICARSEGAELRRLVTDLNMYARDGRNRLEGLCRAARRTALTFRCSRGCNGGDRLGAASRPRSPRMHSAGGTNFSSTPGRRLERAVQQHTCESNRRWRADPVGGIAREEVSDLRLVGCSTRALARSARSRRRALRF